MIGWRARLGFLLPPGNPTVEPEMIGLAPQGVSLHFHRMTAHGATGSLEGQDERNRMMVDNIDGSIELLAMVNSERAYGLARLADKQDAEAVFLSGTGLPTLPVLELLEQDLGKPVISSASAMMWHALRLAGVRQPIPGYGRLLTLD
jgi:maleate cis-trans isomerase